MFPERRMRSRRRSLNPTKAVFVYVTALILVCFHQAGRVADWFDDLALGSRGFISEAALKASASLRADVVPRGPAQMNEAEDRLLAMVPSSLLDEMPEPEVFAPLPGQSYYIARKLEPLPSTAPAETAAPARTITPPTFIYELFTMRTAPFVAPQKPNNDRPKIFNPSSVLLLGDSMMLEGLGPQLQRELKKYEGLTVNRDGRYGTGLTRLDAFDWLAYFDQILAKYDPALIIITLGANDPQDILDPDGPKKRIPVGGVEWNAIYAERVKALLDKADFNNTQIFWVGLPIMGREPYGQRVANINSITAQVCSAAVNCRFWDSWLSVADAQGHYTSFVRDDQGRSIRIRAKDFIHLTEDGGRIMAQKFLDETAGWADYNQSVEPAAASVDETSNEDPAASPPAGEVAEHRFFSEILKREVVFHTAAPAEPGQFPVVFLLHGAWDGAEAWREHLGEDGLAALAAEHRLFLVMPDGEPFGWYLDGRETAIESYLMKELAPLVLRNPAADSGRVGLAGLSMGGHGALTLAIKYPQIFKAAGSMSGITDLTAHSGDGHKLDPELRIERVLGPAGPDGRLWSGHSAYALTEANPSIWGGRPLIISVGRDDRLTLDENRAFHDLLTRLDITHVYNESEGGHDWSYWAGQLPIHLEFLSKKLREVEK